MIRYRRFRQVKAAGSEARPRVMGAVEKDPGSGAIGSETNSSLSASSALKG